MISPSHIPFIYDQPVYVIKDKESKEAVILSKANSDIPTDNKQIAPLTSAVKKNSDQLEKIISEETKVEPIKVIPALDKSLEIIKEKCLKKIWLWVNPKDGDTISAVEYDMILKTMAALGKPLEEVSIFVPQEVAHSYFNKLDFKDCRIVDFGMCSPNINSTSLLPNKIQIIRNSKYLYTYSLHDLQEDIALKKEWWLQMKVLLV